MNRKHKKRPDIDKKLKFLKKFKIFTKYFFSILSSPKVVQPYSHLNTCCIVTDNKNIPDKAVPTRLIHSLSRDDRGTILCQLPKSN